jgi:hypothetical protein
MVDFRGIQYPEHNGRVGYPGVVAVGKTSPIVQTFSLLEVDKKSFYK